MINLLTPLCLTHPYSTKWAGKDDMALVNDPRFSPAGVLAPSSKADLAFTMHIAALAS